MVVALWNDHHWWIGIARSPTIVATLVEHLNKATMELDWSMHTAHHVAIRMA